MDLLFVPSHMPGGVILLTMDLDLEYPVGPRVRELLWDYIRDQKMDSSQVGVPKELVASGLDDLFRGTIVDFGAGNGAMAELAVQKGASKVFAVDVKVYPVQRDTERIQWVYADFADFSEGKGFSAEAVGLQNCGDVPGEFYSLEFAHAQDFRDMRFDLGILSWPLNKRHVANTMPALEKCERILLVVSKDPSLQFGTPKLGNYLRQRQLTRRVDTATQRCYVYGPPTPNSAKLAGDHQYEW